MIRMITERSEGYERGETRDEVSTKLWINMKMGGFILLHFSWESFKSCKFRFKE